MFEQAGVDVFASTHTCLPALESFAGGVVANNGSAGMPNFEGARAGLFTRIGRRPIAHAVPVFGIEAAGAHIEIASIEYDHERWLRRFLAAWPEGSPAHASYLRRIVDGPGFAPPPACQSRL